MFEAIGIVSEDREELPSRVAGLLQDDIARSMVCAVVSTVCAEDEVIQVATAAFVATLRRLVDQWIDSGIHEGDRYVSESWKRSIDWTSAEYPQSLRKRLLTFAAANPPRFLLGTDGRFAVNAPPPITADPLKTAKSWAIQWFIYLLNSPTREKLSRCDGCSNYFVRTRMPKKDLPVYHGTFCRKCKIEGSERRTKKSRQERNDERIKLAAAALLKWRPTRRFGEKKNWIKDELNHRLPAGQRPIKVNWVSMHWAEIEAEAVRRKTDGN